VLLYPAIDVLDGRAVRLHQGDFEDPTVYDADPLAAAQAWVQAGAQRLHVVDLDGARAGEPRSLEHVRRIASASGVPVQVGGGLRSQPAVAAVLSAGAARVVLGTAALRDPPLLDELLDAHGERIAVAVDVRDGRVSAAGWRETGEEGPATVIERLQAQGARTMVYTDVDRDGMLEGPDLDAVRGIASSFDGAVIYSGGIGSLADLERLSQLESDGLDGVIVGKALYERRFTVAEARTALGE